MFWSTSELLEPVLNGMLLIFDSSGQPTYQDRTRHGREGEGCRESCKNLLQLQHK